MTLLIWSLMAVSGLVLLALDLAWWHVWLLLPPALLLIVIGEWRLVRGWRS